MFAKFNAIIHSPEGIVMKVNTLFIIVTFFLVASVNCEAEIKPFLFTISPSDSDNQKVTLHFDAGVGDGSLGFSDAPSADSRIGVVEFEFAVDVPWKHIIWER
jgi:hypothetical protein